MDSNDVLALVKAGFTKEEIMAMAKPAESPKETPKEETEQKPVETAVKKNSDGENGLDVESLKADIMADVTKMFQAKNREDAVSDTPKEETITDIFKSLVGGEIEK